HGRAQQVEFDHKALVGELALLRTAVHLAKGGSRGQEAERGRARSPARAVGAIALRAGRRAAIRSASQASKPAMEKSLADRPCRSVRLTMPMTNGVSSPGWSVPATSRPRSIWA